MRGLRLCVTARSARTLRSPIPRLPTEFPPARDYPKPDEPWKTPHRGLLRSWTYTDSLLSSTPAGRNSRRLGRGDRSSTPQSAAGSLTSVSEDHADEPNTTNRICSFTVVGSSSLSQLFSISFRRQVAIIRYFSEIRDRDVDARDRASLGHRRTALGGRRAPAHRPTRGCSTATLSSQTGARWRSKTPRQRPARRRVAPTTEERPVRIVLGFPFQWVCELLNPAPVPAAIDDIANCRPAETESP